MVAASALAQGVPPQIALAVASHESGFNPNATNNNTNGTTDYGVMQLNSTTVQTLGLSNPLDPQANIDAGVGLLAGYLRQYGGDEAKALQAYASGPGTVASGSAPNATASQFIDYVQGYTPQAGIDLGTSAATVAGLDTTAATDDGGMTDAATASTSGLLDPTTALMIGTGVLGVLLLVTLSRR